MRSGRDEPNSYRQLFAIEDTTLRAKRLLEGDPLEIRRRCEGLLIRRALLLDVGTLFLRALGDVALSAPEYPDDPPFDEWMEDRIGGVVEVLLEEDREEERKALPPEEPLEDRFRCLVEALGIEPGLSRKACNVANRLEDGVRHAFFAMIVERKTVDEFAEEYGETRERAKTLVHRALLAVSLMNREEEKEDG